MALTERQIQTLRELESANRNLTEVGYRDGWAKPLDCGGSNASHHSATLGSLHKRGLVDRKGYTPGCRAVWTYRINDAGKAILSEKGILHQDVRHQRTLSRLKAQTQIDEVSGCWNWTGSLAGGGYGQILIDNEPCRLHRLSYEIHRGPIPEGLFVCHHCDNRACFNPAHLFLGTNADNMADMVAKGRQRPAQGEAVGTSKLTEADVIAIRSAVGMTHEQLASRYGISRPQVSNLRRGRGWTHIQ